MLKEVLQILTRFWSSLSFLPSQLKRSRNSVSPSWTPQCQYRGGPTRLRWLRQARWPLNSHWLSSASVHLLTPGLLYYFLLFLMEEMFTAVSSVLKNLDPVHMATESWPCTYGNRTSTQYVQQQNLDPVRTAAGLIHRTELVLQWWNISQAWTELVSVLNFVLSCCGHCWAQRRTRIQQLCLWTGRAAQ